MVAAGVMKMGVRTNVEEVLDAMDAHVEKIRRLALPRTLNKLRDQAGVAAWRYIAEAYGISKALMQKYGRVRMEFATADNPSASIVVGGFTFPLWIFPHRQTARGVVVKLHGQEFLFPHSFMKKGDRTKVFARGSYRAQGGNGSPFKSTGEAFWGFQFGKGRFPISILRTMSARGIWRKGDVRDVMNGRVKEQAEKVLAQEIRYARSQV